MCFPSGTRGATREHDCAQADMKAGFDLASVLASNLPRRAYRALLSRRWPATAVLPSTPLTANPASLLPTNCLSPDVSPSRPLLPHNSELAQVPAPVAEAATNEDEPVMDKQTQEDTAEAQEVNALVPAKTGMLTDDPLLEASVVVEEAAEEAAAEEAANEEAGGSPAPAPEAEIAEQPAEASAAPTPQV